VRIIQIGGYSNLGAPAQPPSASPRGPNIRHRRRAQRSSARGRLRFFPLVDLKDLKCDLLLSLPDVLSNQVANGLTSALDRGMRESEMLAPIKKRVVHRSNQRPRGFYCVRSRAMKKMASIARAAREEILLALLVLTDRYRHRLNGTQRYSPVTVLNGTHRYSTVLTTGTQRYSTVLNGTQRYSMVLNGIRDPSVTRATCVTWDTQILTCYCYF
jgi:hypothetical protein